MAGEEWVKLHNERWLEPLLLLKGKEWWNAVAKVIAAPIVASAEKQGEYATLVATGAVVHVQTMMRTYKNDNNKSLGLYTKYTCLDFVSSHLVSSRLVSKPLNCSIVFLVDGHQPTCPRRLLLHDVVLQVSTAFPTLRSADPSSSVWAFSVSSEPDPSSVMMTSTFISPTVPSSLRIPKEWWTRCHQIPHNSRMEMHLRFQLCLSWN